jgi:uncharacterized surface protein with fasciclin (FAS1) repeats
MEQEKYQRPDWLEGKLFTQIASDEDLSIFTECMKITGYDTILDVSGSFTAFVPDNEAFNLFFQQNPMYGGQVSNIPKPELERIVKFHILQNAWSKLQLQSLDIYGWIDKEDPNNNKPRGYKRQTILKDENKKYWVYSDKGIVSVVDSANSNSYRKVFKQSRKYAPIFFNEYFPINKLSPSDYEFYFNRPFESGNIYYCNAKIVSNEIYAENGFVYKVDRVVAPMLNAEQFLEKTHEGESYKDFLGLVQLFPGFSINLEETYKQVEAKEGLQFDTLYNMTYTDISFDLHEENTGPNTNVSNYTTRYHNALLAPTDEAFRKFIDEVLTAASGYPRWSSYKAVPKEIKKIIANTHLALNPVYRTNIMEGFENGEGDIIRVEETDIVRKGYGSNCTFLGLNKVIVPRAFSSVAGPVYLRPGFSTFMYAIESAKMLPALKLREANYSFYIVPDLSLQADSSLEIVWDDVTTNRYRFRTFNRSSEKFEYISINNLSKKILNQVGTSVPTGVPRKEFIENLAGNYIVVNNEDHSVKGGGNSVFGYLGDSIIAIRPVPMEEPTDNGRTYRVDSWFSPPRIDMYSRLTSYPKFLELMTKAGLYDAKTYSFTFLTEGEFYTIFIPTNKALTDYGADKLSVAELGKLIRYHFVKGEMIFTDGKRPSGKYETLRLDETSTPFQTRYSLLNIRTGIDEIEILDKNGNPYVTIGENEGATNIFIATDADNVSDSPYDFITTGVIHEVDKVLVKE